MSAPNWGFISDGGTFETLMHALLYAKDEGIVLFGRPGKDAGQDARSADGAVVYQAKYRQHLNMDGAIKIALEELENIKKYQDKDHSNYIHWKNARHWTLVANILANPNDEKDWREKVVPEFQNAGLVAEYWGIKVLEGELAQHPHIRDVFFAGENRVLVGLKEAHHRLRNENIGGGSLEKPVIGREAEIQAIKEFVGQDGKRVLPIVGPAGIGKSRLIYESMVLLGQDGWRVLWALPESMSRSSGWFHLLNSNQPTCVAIDDPSDTDLLKAVIEQLAPVERRNWKVVLGCRSTQAEALRPYQKLPLMAEPLTLGPLNEENSKNLLTSNLVHSFEAGYYHTVYKHNRASVMLDAFKDDFQVELRFQKGVFKEGPKRIEGPKVLAIPAFRKLQLHDYPTVLNEARLSALAICLFLAAVKDSPATGLRLLVLDDILIGLDMTNRVKVLDLIQEHFQNTETTVWQIIILTYSKAWFERLKDHLHKPEISPSWKSVVLWEDWRTEDSAP